MAKRFVVVVFVVVVVSCVLLVWYYYCFEGRGVGGGGFVSFRFEPHTVVRCF